MFEKESDTTHRTEPQRDDRRGNGRGRVDSGSEPETLTGAIGSMSTTRAPFLQSFDPTAEEAYWRENFYSRPYVRPGDRWSDLGPAFRLGWEARRRHPFEPWDDVEPRLAEAWSRSPAAVPWAQARRAARDAWDHLTTWFDDRAEESFWRRTFDDDRRAGSYDAYRAAFRFGWEAKRRHVHRTWDEAEPIIEAEWRELGLQRRLPWNEARGAVRVAWLRVERSLPRSGD